MRFFFIILFFCTHISAEIIDITPNVQIKIPANKTYVKYDKFEHMLKNMRDFNLTKNEISNVLLSSKIAGSNGDEIAVHISSKKFFKYEENFKDDFGILENEGMLDDAIFLCAKKFSN